MEHSKKILEELRNISEFVANLPIINPYQVPSGYFEDLSANLIHHIKNTDQEQVNILQIPSKPGSPFNIPENYFDELPGIILKKIKLDQASCEEELEILSPLLLQLKKADTFKLPFGYFEEFSSTIFRRIEETVPEKDELNLSPLLAQLNKTVPYTLPEGYFEEFPSAVLKRIELEEALPEKDELNILSPLLGKLKKEVPYTLPEGYFEEFPADIIAGVNAIEYVNQELESHAPIISDLKIRNVYEVPNGYFDNLGEHILSVVKRRKASVIPISFNRKIFRYGIAALIAGIMSIGALTFYNNNSKPDTDTNIADIKKISNDEIIHYLESTQVTAVENTGTASFAIKDEDVKDLFAGVPDEELKQYLEQHAASKDLIIN